MNKQFVRRMFVYYLCLSFLSLISGFPTMAAETKTLPIGEMVSKGEVKLDMSKDFRDKATSSYSPIFPGTRITTEKGVATIRLSNNSQIGIYANSSFSFDQNDQFTLFQGSVEFYVPSSSELKIRAGNVSIVKSQVQQAGSSAASSSPKNEETFGSISIQPNGSITVKSVQGRISILNPNNTVLAALAPKESVTISKTSDGKLQVAAATAEETAATTESAGFLGISPWGWVGIGAAAIATGVGVGIAAGGSGGGGSVCP